MLLTNLDLIGCAFSLTARKGNFSTRLDGHHLINRFGATWTTTVQKDGLTATNNYRALSVDFVDITVYDTVYCIVKTITYLAFYRCLLLTLV